MNKKDRKELIKNILASICYDEYDEKKLVEMADEQLQNISDSISLTP